MFDLCPILTIDQICIYHSQTNLHKIYILYPDLTFIEACVLEFAVPMPKNFDTILYRNASI
jgi:hypothetical protein